jgi:serine O-acetyltransferase
MFQIIRADFDARRRAAVAAGESALGSMWQRGAIAVAIYRFGRFARELKFPLLGLPAKLLYYVLFYFVQMLTGVSIQAYARIGPRFVVRNHTGIFVLAERIGSDFTVCEGVTVGNIRGKGLPMIGDRVYLEPGCKVLGNVTIGDDVVIRANSLVLNDIPSRSIVIGNPARVLPMQSET